MTKKKKPERKFLRWVDGALKGSPRHIETMEEMETWVSMFRVVKAKCLKSEKLESAEKAWMEKNTLYGGGLLPSFDRWAQHYFAERKLRIDPPTYYKEQKQYDLWVKDEIGKIHLDEIGRKEIKQVLAAHKAAGHGIDQRTSIKNLMGRIYDAAMDFYEKEFDELKLPNPARTSVSVDGDKKPTARKPRILRDPGKVPEYLGTIAELLDAEEKPISNAGCAMGPQLYAAAMIMANTGVRQQNALCLRWKDFNQSQNIIVFEKKIVRATISKAERKLLRQQRRPQPPGLVLVDGTKTGGEPFVKAINEELAEALREHRDLSPFNGENDFICNNGEGSFMRPRYFNEAHRRTCTIIGVEHAKWTPHCWRHQYAKEFLANGGKMRELQGEFGHASSL